MNRIWILLVVLLSLSNVNWAQDQASLEKKRKQVENEIKQTQQAIQQTQNTRANSLKEIINLEKEIALRKNWIEISTKELNAYKSQIEEADKHLQKLESDLGILRNNYANAIYSTYKSYRMSDQLLFVASATSFSDALRRINYLRKVGDYRKEQVHEIENTQNQIAQKIALIEVKKKKQESLLGEQKSQEKELSASKSQKDKLVAQLKVEEGKLNKKLVQKRKEANRLNAQIQAIIAKEIARQKKLEEERVRKEEAERKAKEEAEKKNQKPGQTTKPKPSQPEKKEDLSTTPELAMLSSSFAANQGRLPWPVTNGSIARGYGRYTHPVYGGVMDNKGLDIATGRDASVRSVFKGKVISIVSNPIYKYAVIISHGSYFTVYSRLESVSVSKGQEVAAKQVIGRVFTDPENGNTEVHFEIWKGSTTLNPSSWIAR